VWTGEHVSHQEWLGFIVDLFPKANIFNLITLCVAVGSASLLLLGAIFHREKYRRRFAVIDHLVDQAESNIDRTKED
jgi:hypothetical protein